MNRVFLVGNLTGDIYFDRLLIKGTERSFLRVILMASRPRVISGMRIVLWDEKAELYFPYLQRGSEIAVSGFLQSRQFKGKLVHEIEAVNLILLRNINWEQGETERRKHDRSLPDAGGNHVFIIGSVGEDIYYDHFQRSEGNGEYAFLRLMLTNDEYMKGLRVIVRGSLAELSYPYLQEGSKIAVDGHIQTRDRATGKKVVEVTAEHIAFLENINWEAGEIAQRAKAGHGNKETEHGS
ncbi:MAG: single-stranded DNA-binding protein [Chloroflexi bacterium]|nr:single-stranded DNA-binding protein [Chloroflexota bacterium]